MPTATEREYYAAGFRDGMRAGQGDKALGMPSTELSYSASRIGKAKPTRKLSPWNKFVKANSKKPRFIYKSGSNKGKLNLKKMGVAFRKTPAGKRKK